MPLNFAKLANRLIFLVIQDNCNINAELLFFGSFMGLKAQESKDRAHDLWGGLELSLSLPELQKAYCLRIDQIYVVQCFFMGSFASILNIAVPKYIAVLC